MFKDEQGKIYGPWEVKNCVGVIYHNRTYSWKCKCRHCGYEKTINGTSLRLGRCCHKCEKCGSKG